jgi:nucleoside phosphorylase
VLHHFFSPETTARIEPAEFMAHLLAYQGLDAANFCLRPTVLLPLIPALERRLLRTLGTPQAHPYKIQGQALYNPAPASFSIIASPMGAPIAVMLLEQLVALGARHFLYLGFCGALSTSYRIGDCFIPEQAVREEGTSYHYLPAEIIPTSSVRLNALLLTQAAGKRLPVRQGPIWSTDAPYRETVHKIQYYQNAGIHAVDMEMAALFAVGHYRGCEISALLIVSDECYHPIWNPGFGLPRLRQACQEAVEVGIAAATAIAAG